ncbi:MAG: hypothetical protein E4G99_07220, partial [Anaerolineales bacterium]
MGSSHKGRQMKISFKKRSMVILTLLALAVGANGVSPVYATTFTASNLNDSGAGSLRQAIDDANASPGADTITFNISGTITLGSTLPTIIDAAGLTIDGTGQAVMISGDDLYQVLIVDASASLTLDQLTIANGHSANYGGGIRNDGTLTVTNSTFSGNSTTDSGGAIYNTDTAALSVIDSTFSGNSAEGGGGIINHDTLTVTGSTFSGNNAMSGGAINNQPDSPLTVTNSTFAGN